MAAAALARGAATACAAHSGLAETALAVMLLVGAGLLLRSFASLQRVDPGFQPEHVLTFDLSLPSAQYAENDQIDSSTATCSRD